MDAKVVKVLRFIPSIDELLNSRRIASLRAKHPNFPWTRFVREVVEEFREKLVAEGASKVKADKIRVKTMIGKRVVDAFRLVQEKGMKKVINGTGVILHTNLGRAVLGDEIKSDILEAASSYVNLEYDLELGERKKRGEKMQRLISLATGAEAAMVVNNNAAAVYLIANAYSPPGRVLVSRGELVEIGGSFRLPTILGDAAQEVIEVGTTNRTYIKDYAREARPKDVLMKVHRSNYDIKGFIHEASLDELVELAKKKKCYVVYDLGSGALYDFDSAGISGEEQVNKVIASGVDCVTMSGDKLLGGVQAGIIAGKASFIDRLKSNPLSRAVRVEKITIAAIEALFRSYLFSSDPVSEIPGLSQALGSIDAIKARAERILAEIKSKIKGKYNLAVVDDFAAMGGGSFARREIPSKAIAVRCSSKKAAVELAKRMRTHSTPMIPRIKDKELRFNLRSVLPGSDKDLARNLVLILK